jgi:hypothetical protein
MTSQVIWTPPTVSARVALAQARSRDRAQTASVSTSSLLKESRAGRSASLASSLHQELSTVNVSLPSLSNAVTSMRGELIDTQHHLRDVAIGQLQVQRSVALCMVAAGLEFSEKTGLAAVRSHDMEIMTKATVDSQLATSQALMDLATTILRIRKAFEAARKNLCTLLDSAQLPNPGEHSTDNIAVPALSDDYKAVFDEALAFNETLPTSDHGSTLQSED